MSTKQKCVRQHAMFFRVKELLRNRPKSLTYEQIERDTGVSVAWLQSFATKQVDEAAFSRIANLYEYLSGKKIEVA